MATATLPLLDAPLVIAGRAFRSRLMVGTGKYASNDLMVGAIEASGAEVVTVAVRRVDLDRSKDEGVLHHLDPSRYFLLANTAGCFTVDDTVRYARLARAAGFNEWIKLEVIGDQQTLLPDAAATIEATRVLAAEGFKVMAYTNDDLISALRLEDAGAVCVMPLASPIGSGRGILNRASLEIIVEEATVPVVVDAGLGVPSEAAAAMELGADAVLVNTALAESRDPVAMAAAFRKAVEAGREALLAGRMTMRAHASPSSPTAGVVRMPDPEVPA